MGKVKKGRIIESLRDLETPHTIGYAVPNRIRLDLANALEEPDFRSLSELITEALDTWLRDWRDKEKRVVEAKEISLGTRKARAFKDSLKDQG